VPTWGTVDWIDGLQMDVASDWQMWQSPLTDKRGAPKQRAGYVKSYSTNNFTFATVQGAGHLVPTYKPKFALTMISKWLDNEPLA
jgi:serine carboxypeptidase-like clade 1